MFFIIYCTALEIIKKLKKICYKFKKLLFLINIFKEEGKKRVLWVPVLEAASLGVAEGQDCTPRPCPDALPGTREPETRRS